MTWNQSQSSDCCQWNGVRCNGSTGHVIGIDLSGESITNSIDNLSSLFSLQFLQSLNLANNSFTTAQIPSEIGNLSSLTYLNLSNTGYNGQVPLEISQLVKLEILDLSSLSYSGFSPLKLENPSLGMLVQNLTNIKQLYLDCVLISANGSEWCKAISSSLPNLQVLSLSSCNLSGEIDQSLEKLHSLSVIRLDQNNLAAPVPDFIANFRNLTLLKLSNSQLNGTFPQKILQVPTLTSLDLSYNTLLQGTLPEFPVNGSLQKLILTSTGFSGKLPDSVGNLRQFHRIELVNCSFSGSIPSSMAKLNQLVYLDLSSNKFSGTIPSFSSARKLTYLSLSNNTLSGTLASTNWGSLVNLVNLDLSSNSLKGTIPMSLFSMKSLQKMLLYENGFRGQLGEFTNISSSILDTLDLTNNELEGSVPTSLFGLKGLNILNLSSNNFTGFLKLNVIQQLKNLSTLELSQNRLSVDANEISSNFSSLPQLRSLKLGSCNLGVLPEFLRNQSKLQFLDLSDNHIQGDIPKWIWTVGNGSLAYVNLSCNNFVRMERPLPETPFLSFLDIHSNKLQGEIPTLSSMAAIYLDYSMNQFTSIGQNIGKHLPYTSFLFLSNNNISGEIPKALCNANFLQVLDLSNNHLNGTIPDCVIKMTRTLGVLNMKGNLLNGTILDVFPEDCSLSTIDISDNHLEGKLPRSLAKCKQLEVLELTRNQLHDKFPCWLRILSNLRVLVLRSNHFHGSIVCSVSNMTWPVLQIVDLASNNFNGELKAEGFSKMTALMTGGNNSESTRTQLRYPVLRLDNIYYQNMLVVTIKGTELKLLKILTLFRSIDLSINKFQGHIPGVIGNLDGLIALNLSHNALSGSIPSSIGNLTMLESLDLSHNSLSGGIPEQFVGLNFLECLDLSYNQLEGVIPKGTQLQSFDSSSYIGNKGLCGQPLTNKCQTPHDSVQCIVPSVKERKSSPRTGFDWEFILLGTGFGTGAGLVIAPLIVWKKGRKWYDEQSDKLALVILSAFGIGLYAGLGEGRLEPGEGIGHQLFEVSFYDEDDDDEDEHEHGRFCVFCSKLDIKRKRVIHNPSCRCRGSPSISSSSLST